MKRTSPIPLALTLCVAMLAAVIDPAAGDTPAFRAARNAMVDNDIVAAGIKDPRVIQSMRDTPRHEFVPGVQRLNAYYDMALPIGHRQTISAPFIVAYMTEQIRPKPTDRVLEIGTGSGYQAAVLSPLVRDVYSIEIVNALGRKAEETLKHLKYKNVHTKVGDGYQGWAEHAPFDKIIVTCSPEHIPRALFEQLAEGGEMLIPVGERYQQSLYRLTKRKGKLETEKLLPILFVPMTGTAETYRRVQPDPTNPQIINGSFEEMIEDKAASGPKTKNAQSKDTEPLKPAGWYYQRQIEVVRSPLDAPYGDCYARFVNKVPGRASQALQGFAVDGRKVRRLVVSASIKGKDIRQGQDQTQVPVISIAFYDKNRDMLGQQYLGPWTGTFDWQRDTVTFLVPKQAREAIVRIGLFGATGEWCVDSLEVKSGK